VENWRFDHSWGNGISGCRWAEWEREAGEVSGKLEIVETDTGDPWSVEKELKGEGTFSSQKIDVTLCVHSYIFAVNTYFTLKQQNKEKLL